MRPTLIELLAAEKLKTLKLGIPELTAWCFWGKILVKKGAAASPKASVRELAVPSDGSSFRSAPARRRLRGKATDVGAFEYAR